ncbi:hypothetical protein ACYSNN_04615 [Peptoniphilus genitalis]
MAIFLLDKYPDLFIKSEIGEIIGIDDEKLRASINQDKYEEEYKELNTLFEWE